MSEYSIEQMMHRAVENHRFGRLGDAEPGYRQVLTLDPNHSGALQLLGIIASSLGRHGVAIDLIRRAIAIHPSPDYFSNLGDVLRISGRLDEAIAACRQGIAINDSHAELYNNLGTALREKGLLSEAIAAYRRAAELRPESVQILHNLARTLQSDHQVEAAISAYQAAAQLAQDAAEIYNNLACALLEGGRTGEAFDAVQKATVLNPDTAEIHNTRGTILRSQGKRPEAVAAYELSLRIKPDYPIAHSNLGNAFRDQGQYLEAIAAYRKALELDPTHADAWNNLGAALLEMGRIDEALAACREATRLAPGDAIAHNTFGNCHRQVAAHDLAIESYRRALALDPHNSEIHSNLVFSLSFHPGKNAADLLAEAIQWDRQHGAALFPHIAPFSSDRSTARRLRIGYVSPDFREHVVGYNLLPLMRAHDRARFEIYCYSNVQRADKVTAEFQSLSDGWREIAGIADEEAEAIIRRDKIDILVDLALHTANNRLPLFARKPAPIQASYFGYPGTTGVSAIDYRISDPFIDPPGGGLSIYSERTVRLPRCSWCYEPAGPAPIPSPLPALKNGHVTFASRNNFAKTSAELMDLWATILSAVPSSRFLLHAPAGSVRAAVLDRFESAGVRTSRIQFFGEKEPWEQFVKSYDSIDIALDTHPYGGWITTCDALWMGVPVVSLSGQTAVGRGGRSILSNAGLTELIADTPAEYRQIAVSLASDLSRLGEMRAGLRERMEQSPLRDANRFAKDMEELYHAMWLDYIKAP